LLPLPVDLAGLNKNHDNLTKLSAGKLILLSVGRLVRVKNFSFLIRVFSEFYKNFPSSELWLVGSGPGEKKIKRQIKRLKLAKQIRLFGWQKNVGHFYQAADIFVLASRSEGFGLAVLEAAYFGRPVVMTDTGLAGEVIFHEHNGLIVQPDQFADLLAALTRLAADAGLRKRLGNQALADVMAE